MFVLLKCIFLRDGDDAAVSALQQSLDEVVCLVPAHSHLTQRTVHNAPGEPQLVLRITFATEESCEACLLHPLWIERVEPLLDSRTPGRIESITYEQGRGGARRPDIMNGAWRALIVSVKTGTLRETRELFEDQMLALPQYILSIRNWSLSRVLASSGTRHWSHVWEQDFDDVDAPFGEYRAHPFHWGVVDRWFDVENPQHILEGRLLRVICPSATSVVVPQPRIGLSNE